MRLRNIDSIVKEGYYVSGGKMLKPHIEETKELYDAGEEALGALKATESYEGIVFGHFHESYVKVSDNRPIMNKDMIRAFSMENQKLGVPLYGNSK